MCFFFLASPSFYFYFFIYFDHTGSFFAELSLSLVAASGGYSLVSELGLPIAVASLVAEHRLQSTQASVV